MIGTPGGTPEKPALFFTGPDEFRAWLEEHHQTADELWMGLWKSHVPDRGLTWKDAVPEALCFGWIDSVSQRIDDDARRQRWTPRRSGSNWSEVNVAHVERLLAEGRMHPAGIAAYEARQADRTGTYSFEGGREDELPDELPARLAEHPGAAAFWAGATASYRRAVVHWVVSAKREATREKRLAELVDCCSRGILVGFQRYGDEPAWARRMRAELGLGEEAAD
ncbi:YdeI/OmpD-associated family protein [Nocardioides campestrisoli]|uniref:YdeI/OmpD-associated family protein n=1 Tax=Nocardioides campestrisoli TaxID=2736757 RepID=UPI0015E68F8C|nr:YdeI/OmpD-associated family protein [Nocardioides campestrisoli]